MHSLELPEVAEPPQLWSPPPRFFALRAPLLPCPQDPLPLLLAPPGHPTWVRHALLSWLPRWPYLHPTPIGTTCHSVAGGQGATEDEMIGWHHQLNAHKFEQAPGVVMDREAQHAAVHGVTKSWTHWSNWTTATQPFCQSHHTYLKILRCRRVHAEHPVFFSSSCARCHPARLGGHPTPVLPGLLLLSLGHSRPWPSHLPACRIRWFQHNGQHRAAVW